MPKILIIEDEEDIAELIAFNLQRQGYETLKALDGTNGVITALQQLPDLIILDLMLPGKNGITVFKELKRDSRTNETPIIMLTARSQTEDRIAGLELGADDYMTKPFSPKELLLRIAAILKRTSHTTSAVDFQFENFRFDKNAIKLYLNGEPTDITATEFRLLLYLCERNNKPLDRNDILQAVWGYNQEVNSRTLDTHIKRIRQKLGPTGDLIETVRSVGYIIRSPKP